MSRRLVMVTQSPSRSQKRSASGPLPGSAAWQAASKSASEAERGRARGRAGASLPARLRRTTIWLGCAAGRAGRCASEKEA